MKHHRGALSGSFLSPREFLRAAERRAVRMRKLLRQEYCCKAGAGVSGFEEALRLVELIEKLAQRGQKVRAAEALRIVESVDQLIGLLVHQV